MKIHTPNDLFGLYDFDDEVKIQISQFYNANKDIIHKINALCLKAKLSKVNNESFTHLHTNYYLVKTIDLRLVFIKDSDTLRFTSISLIKKS